MTWRVSFALLVSLLLAAALQADPPSRTLMHTYQSEGILVKISFVDLPAGPVCHIDDGRIASASLKVRDFGISKHEFDHLWTVVTSNELRPFEQKKDVSPSATAEALNNYVFTVGEMPDGDVKLFIVPKDRAPKSAAELVREIRAYNRD
jgi:hypothetical protein